MKNWYSIQAKSNNAASEISIYDEIGAWGVTAKDFIAELKALDAGTIKVLINSPGGSVFDALAMFNALRQHPANIEVTVMGVVASAASLIAMAGDKIIMPANAFMMIHNPLNFAYGNAEELREIADVLDKIGASLVAIYVKRTGLPEEEIKALLDAETWLNADEALAKGFADEVQEEMKIAARFDLDRLPENIRASIAPPADEPEPAPTPEPEPEDDHPLDATARSLAVSIIAKASAAGIAAHADVFLLDAAITSEADADAAIAEAKTIVAICAAAKLPEMAAGMIKARAPVATVRSRLQTIRAELDAALHTSNHIPQPNNAGQTAAAVWAKVLPPKRQTKE